MLHALVAATAQSLSLPNQPAPVAVLAGAISLYAGYLALASLPVFFVLWQRRASRARIIVGLLAVIAAALFLAAAIASVTLERMALLWGLLLLAVPMFSFVVASVGVVWIAFHWRAFDPHRCGTCGQTLLREQELCPECGVSRERSRNGSWRGRHMRAQTLTMLAVVCGIVSLLAVCLVDALPLEWRCTFNTMIIDRNDAMLAVVEGDATVHRAAITLRTPGQSILHGPTATVRVVHSATVFARSTSGPPHVARLVEDAMGEGVSNATLAAHLASLPPSAAAAAESWMRTVSSRCAGVDAPYIDAIQRVATNVILQRTSIGVLVLAMLAGPLTAGALGLILRKWLTRDGA